MADTSVAKQIAEKIKDSNNILVTVNTNPTVDELSAALGITLLINKLGKHATAIFSGAVPPAIKFLEPEKTFESTVDSLRDFIIALDKEKADHLRYKVVDDMVKIFITPYRTTITQDDLDFSQGDYNVEMVVAVGVQNEADLDHALESHGRILHDATVAAISLGEPTKLGGIEWADGNASSYGEMLYTLADILKTDTAKLDEQISTAFLTGIVAATDRFSNNKTTSNVMTIAAHLMSAGANQQLIANELKADNTISSSSSESTKVSKMDSPEDGKAGGAVGGLSISHIPEGTLEQVEEQIHAEHTETVVPTISRAEQELVKQSELVMKSEQADATEEAEQKLAEQLAVSPPAVPAAELISPAQSADNGPLRGAVPVDQWRKPEIGAMPEPSFGGALNATTEQAADDQQRAIEDDRNKTILTHGGTGYVSGEPSFQTSMSAAMSDQQAEPTSSDALLSSAVPEPTAHIEAIQPPAPSMPAPTLAEIDAQNRAAHTDAMDAVSAALGAPMQPVAQPVSGAPALPPLPPMPDFSTLPPLPNPPTIGGAPQPFASPEPTLAPVAMQPLAVDPAQFKIPGQ